MKEKRSQPLMNPACRVCGNPVSFLFQTVQGYDLHSCNSCGFVQVSRKPDAAELDQIYQESYFGHGKYRDKETLNAENQRRFGMLRKLVKPGGSVLEIGCGEGSFLQLAKEEYHVTGFDLSKAGIKIAREQNPEIADRIHIESIETYPENQEMFDAICMWDVLEHIWDPLPISDKILRMLKPSGKLLISTPNIHSLTARVMKKRWAFITPPEHLGFFSPKSVRFLFESKLDGQVIEIRSLGKKVNLGFLIYKLRRVFPLLPGAILNLVERSPRLTGISLYVPTGDILYFGVEKRS
jgi:2-polyprenyl-3-methyl-5-hydroxy-6-metoxy-1,4-benzoquinol methylase